VSRILVPGKNCWSVERTRRAGVLVDARDYYRAFYQAMSGARRYALLAGWQFDSDVRLLRGDDATGAPWPVEFLPFLMALCRERPELSISVLAWDYSVVYTLEREWMQRLKFDFGTSDQIHYLLDGKHPLGASHHQKIVVIDGRIAFVGGADICDGRWDDRGHERENSERVNRYGEPYKPYHEVIGFFTGDAVANVERLFRARWRHASGADLPAALPAEEEATNKTLFPFEGALSVDSERVALARTYVPLDESESPTQEIRVLFEDAIAAAERLLYIETQYITARALHDAVVTRLTDAAKPRLQVIIVVPHGADSIKEKLVLGAAEDQWLHTVAQVAESAGHTLRVLFSASSDGAKDAPPTYIHAKLLIVDDRFMTLGSANCTNRSMSFDSELNLAWECERGDEPLARSIAQIRASLLSEHAGIDYDAALEAIDGLVEHLDELLQRGTRLRLRPLEQGEGDTPPMPIMQLAFDPEGPLLESALGELLGPKRGARLKDPEIMEPDLGTDD
jgi:phosphatidylserine/phosphatidylglycerophosphate/cardiolipin synthase-like enzyme